MIILTKVLHTSRPVETTDTKKKLAKNFETVLSLKPGTVKIQMKKHRKLAVCKTHPEFPHCHYAITISYDETKTVQ